MAPSIAGFPGLRADPIERESNVERLPHGRKAKAGRESQPKLALLI